MIRLTPMTPIGGMTRLNATVTWASLVDTPFQISNAIPAE
jgi:hypothetical protein